jgi:hypothetical protein
VIGDGNLLYYVGFISPEQTWQNIQPIIQDISKTVAFHSPSSRAGGGISNDLFESHMTAKFGGSQGGFIGPVTPCHSQSMEPRCQRINFFFV